VGVSVCEFIPPGLAEDLPPHSMVLWPLGSDHHLRSGGMAQAAEPSKCKQV
jgi:hypothetical protein